MSLPKCTHPGCGRDVIWKETHGWLHRPENPAHGQEAVYPHADTTGHEPNGNWFDDDEESHDH